MLYRCLLILLSLYLHHQSAARCCSSFNCKKWTFKNANYYLSDLDRVFTSHSTKMDARISICQPLSSEYLKAPNGRNTGSCPAGSHICVWHSDLGPDEGVLAAFGSIAYTMVNAKGDILLFFFDGTLNNGNETFPLMSRVALVYNSVDKASQGELCA